MIKSLCDALSKSLKSFFFQISPFHLICMPPQQKFLDPFINVFSFDCVPMGSENASMLYKLRRQMFLTPNYCVDIYYYLDIYFSTLSNHQMCSPCVVDDPKYSSSGRNEYRWHILAVLVEVMFVLYPPPCSML